MTNNIEPIDKFLAIWVIVWGTVLVLGGVLILCGFKYPMDVVEWFKNLLK